ncbi:MAG: amidohydrolase family protein [Gemmatimonadaceae bacterium]
MSVRGKSAEEVVDAHVHFWNPEILEYPWLSEARPLNRAFLPSDYAEPRSTAGVTRAVFVEANCVTTDGRREADMIDALARDEPWIAGIVAFVSLADGATSMQALDDLSPLPRVKGVRQNIQGQPAGFCLQPDFVRGVREVGRRGLSFDICVTHDQLKDAVELVRQCPETRFVLDHAGKPSIGRGRRDRWNTDVARLALLPNVWCKLSGLLTEADADHRREEDLAPYALHVQECFGSGRMMYGSDWPILTLAGTYAGWFSFTQRFVERWTAAERQRFYCDNAVDFYGL